jgi:DNA-directed RNA polymerase subunit RPC12/RpoP
MQALDGNAIAGQLMDVFGAEMTTARGKCANCGSVYAMAELIVYLPAPGTVARCRSCESIVMVMVERRGVMCVDLRGLSMV